MLLVDVACGQCPEKIRLAAVRDGPSGAPLRSPEVFSREESELARDLGAFNIVYRPCGQENVPTVACCWNCGNHLGPADWHRYRQQLETGKEVSLRWACPRCGTTPARPKARRQVELKEALARQTGRKLPGGAG